MSSVLWIVVIFLLVVYDILSVLYVLSFFFFFFQAEDGIRDLTVTGVQTCALPISGQPAEGRAKVDVLGERADGPALRHARADHDERHPDVRVEGGLLALVQPVDRKSVV